MRNAGMVESYVMDAAENYVGKLDIFGAISAAENRVLSFVDSEPITLYENDSLQTAMTKTVDFVGESIPIISSDKRRLIAVVSEGSIFQAVIDVQNIVSKIGRA
jgi:CBS domain-containing protein